MPKITIASLERRILVLESEKQTLGGKLSINGEFQLEAFRILLGVMKQEPSAYAGLFLDEEGSPTLSYYATEEELAFDGPAVSIPLFDNWMVYDYD